MTSPLGSFLGRPDEPIQCKTIGDMSIHWWASMDAKPGDPCLCGKLHKRDDEEDTDDSG